MSVEAMAIVLHHSRARGTARLVAIGIANHDGDGGSWPSVATLAKYAGGVHVRNVQRAVDQLVELGEIERVLQEGGDRHTPDEHRPNLYRVLLRCPADCDRTSAHRTARQLRPRGVGRPRKNPVAPAPPPGASATPPPGASATPPPGASATRTVLGTTLGTQLGLGASTTERGTACGQPASQLVEHSCDRGWLDPDPVDPAGRPRPCPLCRPGRAR